MKSFNTRLIRASMAVMLLALAVYANFYTVRSMAQYGVEMYFYDKLLVAYQAGGGMPALEDEMEKVFATSDMPRELAVAREFKKNLPAIKDPEEFLRNTVREKEKKIKLFRCLRNISFALMALIILLRLALNFFAKVK